MVFGWGKNKEKSSSDGPKEISLSEIPKMSQTLLALRENNAISEVNSLREMTVPLIDDLIKIGKALESDNLNVDEIDKHLRIIVVRGKKQVIHTILKDAVQLPTVNTIDDAKSLNEILTQMLKKVGDVLGRQTRIIHIFAKKYAEKLKEILSQIQSNNSEISNVIINHNISKTDYESIISLQNDIVYHQNEIKNNKQKIAELKEFHARSEEKMSSLTYSINQIKSTKEYLEYLQTQQSLDVIISERNKIKDHINSQFTKISRPLGRYEYISSDKEQKSLIVQLLDDPIEIIAPKNKDMIIIVLENMRKQILSGSISVKDVDKSMYQITETIEMLDSFILQVTGFKEKAKHIHDKINQFDTKPIHNIENELEKASHDKLDCEQKMTTLESELEQNTKKIPELVSLLNTKLGQFTNTEYTILV